MGNVFNDGLWILDTPGTGFLLGVTYRVKIKRIEWMPDQAGRTLEITDKAGLVRITKVSIAGTPAGDETWEYDRAPLEINGPVLSTLGGGTVYVHLD